MRDGLSARLRDIFGVLPDKEAASAQSELVERYLGDHDAGLELPWLDFDAGGTPLRGGVTAIGDGSVRIFADPREQRDLAALARLASAETALAGRVVAARDATGLYWYAPIASASGAGKALLRGLAVQPALFAALVDRFDADRNVTAAEKRLLFQLVAGLNPREAAEADAVSFETKRAQVKSLCAKLDCNGQTDLVRRAMGQLVHLLHLTERGAADARIAEDFARVYLPASVSLTLHRVGTGRAVRTLECGPPNGRPVLVAHGMLFPLVLLNATVACHRLGLRLIMPIRSGYLDDQSAGALFREADRAGEQADIAQLVSRFGSSIAVVGHSVGASWALAFARAHPERIANLVLLSPNFLGDRRKGSIFSSFLDGLGSLAARPGLLRFIAWQFRKQFIDPAVVRRTWRRICGDSADDLAVLDGRKGAGPIYDWFEAGYRSSVGGVADDMGAAAGSWREELDGLPCPVAIIVGAGDPVAGYARDAEAITAMPGITLRSLPAGGHLVCASHAGQAWQAVAEALRDRGER